MIPPKEFAQELDKAFDGRLRIRWSLGRKEWQIEQKYRRTRLGRWFDERDDRAIRVRDGYTFVLAVRPGDRMPCPKCGRELKVPAMRFGETMCVCGTSTQASYWPLGSSLIEHLKRYDPYRGGIERLQAEMDQYETKKVKDERRSEVNLAEDVAKDTFTQIFNIPSVGYTGREFKGER